MTYSRRTPAYEKLLDHEWTLLIAGERRHARGKDTYDVEDPSRATTIAAVPDASAGDVDAAVQGAYAARRDWRYTAARERGRLVRQAADVLEHHAEELAWLDSVNGGIPITVAEKDVRDGLDQMRMFAEWSMLTTGQTIPASPWNLHLTEREPYGVVGRIIPFNHPFLFSVTKVAAPLVAGNCVVLKAPDQAPLSALRMSEIVADVLPPGVLSVLSGRGAGAGEALVRAPLVRRVAFTGSARTGLAVQRAAAEVGVKHVSLELGGKNAMIVFPDTHVDAVVAGAVKGMNLGFAGQSCGSTSRVLVHESVAEEVTAGLVEAFGRLRVGDALDERTQVGPLVSRRQYDHVVACLDRAEAEGATRLVGGPRSGAPVDGYFVVPTVLIGVESGDSVFGEEIFGPVVCVIPFASEEDALHLANDVEYGLTASVWTHDLDRAYRLTRELEAGYVWVNDSTTHFIGTPFGGFKNSGTGREESVDEVLSYTLQKTVHVVLR